MTSEFLGRTSRPAHLVVVDARITNSSAETYLLALRQTESAMEETLGSDVPTPLPV